MFLFDELSWRRSAIFKLSFCARVRNESSASGLLALPQDNDASGSPPHVHDLAAAPFLLRTSQHMYCVCDHTLQPKRLLSAHNPA